MSIAMNGLKVRETITFGRYPQRGVDAEPEPVEWIVLDINRIAVTLISRRALDTMPYSTDASSASWESCTLRSWLNNHFVDVAFNDDERAMLMSVKVLAGVNPTYPTDPGNDTRDRVFLLSIEEVEKLSGRNRICTATAYAKARGATTNRADSCRWWLRSPGREPGRAAFMVRGGDIYPSGSSVSDHSIAVRPVIVLRLT